MLSKQEVDKFCKNTSHLYNALVANGYFLPPLKNQFVTQKFLLEVFKDECHCPRIKDVRILPCLSPPTIAFLVDMIAGTIENHPGYNTQAQADSYKRLALHMRKHNPDKQWLLALLSTLQPDSELFRKGYKPPNRQAWYQQQQAVPNKEGFFDDLAPLNAKELRKKGSINFLSKREKLQLELDRIAEREQRLVLSKQKKEADLALCDDEDDGFRVKISLADYEVLKRAKIQAQANEMIIDRVEQMQEQQQEQPNNFRQQIEEQAQRKSEHMQAMGQQMFEQQNAEDNQFFDVQATSPQEMSLNSQPIHTQTNLQTGNLFGLSRLKSPTKLKSAKKRDTTPYKMELRRDKGKRHADIMVDLLKEEKKNQK